MSDATLLWNDDLSANGSGDIALSSGDRLGEQRILRRLLTNPGDYIWHPEYGAGLGQTIGQVCNVAEIRAKVRAQVFLEESVARTPEPEIKVHSVADGSVYVHIRYVDSSTGVSQVLSFSVSA